MKRGVVIYESWAPLLRRLPVALRGEVVLYVLDFSATGEQVFTDDPAADMLLSLMYNEVKEQHEEDEAQEAREKELSEKRAEAGRKGMERRWADNKNNKNNKDNKNNTCYTCYNGDNKNNKNNTCYTEEKKEKGPLNILQDIQKEKKEEQEKHILTYVQKEKAADAATRTPAQVRHDKFMAWLAENCPYIAQHYKLPSPELLEKLITRYGAEAVAEECGNIENRLDKRKNYTNLYQTLNNWLKRDYGDNKGNNAEGGREQRARSYAAVMQQLLDEDDRRAAEAAAHVQPVGAN